MQGLNQVARFSTACQQVSSLAIAYCEELATCRDQVRSFLKGDAHVADVGRLYRTQRQRIWPLHGCNVWHDCR